MTAAVLLAACKKEEPPPAYQAIPIARRDIVVSALASGTVQPDTVVEVKSKASGEILDLRVETGQAVKRGDLMVRVDPRTPSNILAQAKADLDVAEARLANGTSQKRRSDELFESQSITEQEHENALLDYANARAEVVRAKVAVDDAQNQMDDTNVRAPISGTTADCVARTHAIASCDAVTPLLAASRCSCSTSRSFRSRFSPAKRGRCDRRSPGAAVFEPLRSPRDRTP